MEAGDVLFTIKVLMQVTRTAAKRDMPRAMVKVKKSEKKLASTMVMILVTPTG